MINSLNSLMERPGKRNARRLGRMTAIVAAALLLIGCGTARRDIPLVGPMSLTSADVVRGRGVFMNHCYQCHPGGAAGLGPAINNKPLPGWLIKTQVRNGLGAMPAFSEEQIEEGELDDLVRYLVERRTHEDGPAEAS